MTQAKAHELAVEQTVNVCRLNSRSELANSILASTTFTDSKDVVAKMIVEHNNEVKERQVLSFRSRANRPNSFRGGFRGHNNYGYHKNSFRFNNGNTNRHNNGNNTRHSSQNNYNRSNNFNNKQNSYRNGTSNRSASNRNNSSRSNSRNTSNVRFLNADSPQERTLGEQELSN
ncbi:PREDICTED: putative uncharacterized protein DDB_G0283431 [Rhagoletis zephyria]|uniref:putative uncharacterized protein DDB_G0283431 n=1 Tax=Rhagoletis zephyria TaxID=28612 RepID=UPI0008118328|nr:PREDICTED: putative uncharacterized protein DDB_G0283431 [Rhagoletis zephyria]